MRIVIFEGVDKSGKSTLAKEFNKKTGFKHLVIDRLFLSKLAYDRVYKRDCLLRDYIDFSISFADMIKYIVIIYVYASPSIIKQRLKTTGHSKINVEKDLEAFEKGIKILNTYFFNPKKENIHILRVNTTTNSVEKCTKDIVHFVRRIDEPSYAKYKKRRKND